MIGFFLFICAAFVLGIVAVVTFLWSLRNGQYEDLDGAAHRILMRDNDTPE